MFSTLYNIKIKEQQKIKLFIGLISCNDKDIIEQSFDFIEKNIHILLKSKNSFFIRKLSLVLNDENYRIYCEFLINTLIKKNIKINITRDHISELITYGLTDLSLEMYKKIYFFYKLKNKDFLFALKLNDEKMKFLIQENYIFKRTVSKELFAFFNNEQKVENIKRYARLTGTLQIKMLELLIDNLNPYQLKDCKAALKYANQESIDQLINKKINLENLAILALLTNDKKIKKLLWIKNKQYNLPIKSFPIADLFEEDFLYEDKVYDFLKRNGFSNKGVINKIINSIWIEYTKTTKILYLNGIISVLFLKQVMPDVDEQLFYPALEVNSNEYQKMIRTILNDISLRWIYNTFINKECNDNIVKMYKIIYKEYGPKTTIKLFLKSLNLEYDIFNENNVVSEDIIYMYNRIKAIMNIEFPKKIKSIKMFHDFLTLENQKISQINHKLNQSLKGLDGIKFNEYKIKIPQYSHDLIEVGVSLNICVGNGHYSSKILKKKSNIILLLDNKNKVKVCVELLNGKIIQAKKHSNTDMCSKYVKELEELIIKKNVL